MITNFFGPPAAKRARLTQDDDSDPISEVNSDSGDDDDDVPLLRFARRRPAASQSSGSTVATAVAASADAAAPAPGGRSRSLASYVRSRGSCDARSRPGAAWRSEPSRDVAVERSRIHRALRLRTFANHAAPLRTRLDHVDSSDAENGIPARRRGRIASMAFNSNGAYLASGDKDGYIQLHNFNKVFHNDRVAVARTAPAHTMATPGGRSIDQLRWCPWSRNETAVSYSFVGEIRIFDLSRCGDDPTHVLVTQSSARSTRGLQRQASGSSSHGSSEFCFVPDRPHTVAAIDRAGTMRLWDLRAAGSGMDVTPQWAFSPLIRRGKWAAPGTGIMWAAPGIPSLCSDRAGNRLFCTDGDDISCWDLRRFETIGMATRQQPVKHWQRGAIGAMLGVRSLLGSACGAALPKTRRDWLRTTTFDGQRVAQEPSVPAEVSSAKPKKPVISMDRPGTLAAAAAAAAARRRRAPAQKVVAMWPHPSGPSMRILIALRGNMVLDVDLTETNERVIALTRGNTTSSGLRCASSSSSARGSSASESKTFGESMNRGFNGVPAPLVDETSARQSRRASGVAEQRHCCALGTAARSTETVLYLASDGGSTLRCLDIASPLRPSSTSSCIPCPNEVYVKLPSAPTALAMHPVVDAIAMAAVDIDGKSQCNVVGLGSHGIPS